MAQEIGAGHGAEPFADLDPPDRDSAERLGRALGGEFQVRRLVGRGGFARVFEVFDAALDRRLAVKVLRSDVPWGPASITRFKQEARAIARLSHPNILPIHFVGEAEGLGFYAMPFLEGRPLTALILDGPLQPARALGIAEPMLGALQHAHAIGIVHRDIKPDNIMIEAGTERPLLVDFGIAKAMDGDGTQTEAGFIVGTPLYMSPEQAMGCGKVDARSDLYAMGVVLFHMLSGAPPFHGGDSQEIMGRHLTDPVPLNRLGDRGTPRWLADIVGRCLTKHPDDRYPSAVAVLDALRAGREAAGFPAPVFGIPTPQPAGPRSVQGAPPGSAA
ncbi:MAG: serine/threonine protein kinase, partial [Gemmatimonadales bacterium]|nr:serine/threonine protein kinase [Gemmatimonadales bacterium]